MGAYLVHVRLKIKVEFVQDVLKALDVDGGELIPISTEGDAVHLLVRHPIGAGHLKNQLSTALSNSFVADFGIVEVRAKCAEWTPSGLTNGTDQAAPSDSDEWDDYDDGEPATVTAWLSDYAVDQPLSGYRRRGLLVFTERERDGAYPIKQLDRMFGDQAKKHWHSSNSILYTYWDRRPIHGVTVSGRLADVLSHRDVSAAFVFDLMNDFVTMYPHLSTLASWFREDMSNSLARGGGAKVQVEGGYNAVKQAKGIAVEIRNRSKLNTRTAGIRPPMPTPLKKPS